MKKISTIFGVLLACLATFTSCEQDPDNWDSAIDYSGRYVVRLFDETGNTQYTDYDGSEIHIYNTAANKANEVWIDDYNSLIPIKSKFFLDGTPADFKSIDTSYEDLTYSEYIGSVSGAPSEAGQVKEVESVYKAVLLEGKITPKSFKTKGGNVTDGILMKMQLYYGVTTFESYELPADSWADPNTPEFAWKQVSMERYSDDDEVITIEGYRYTGFDEDEF